MDKGGLPLVGGQVGISWLAFMKWAPWLTLNGDSRNSSEVWSVMLLVMVSVRYNGLPSNR